MKPKHVIAVVEMYREVLCRREIPAQEHSHETHVQSDAASLSHCRVMLDKIIFFTDQGRTGKAFRWLGFLQGVLWRSGIYTLSELRDHNRSGASDE